MYNGMQLLSSLWSSSSPPDPSDVSQLLRAIESVQASVCAGLRKEGASRPLEQQEEPVDDATVEAFVAHEVQAIWLGALPHDLSPKEAAEAGGELMQGLVSW
jgi:hypothetical protein